MRRRAFCSDPFCRVTAGKIAASGGYEGNEINEQT